MKRKIEPYYVINWDFNKDDIEYYDIMPYLINQYKKLKKNKRPDDFEKIKNFIIDESKYQFWSRCQYEVVITGWPKHKNEVKIDVYDQIKNNINVITEHFIKHL